MRLRLGIYYEDLAVRFYITAFCVIHFPNMDFVFVGRTEMLCVVARLRSSEIQSSYGISDKAVQGWLATRSI